MSLTTLTSSTFSWGVSSLVGRRTLEIGVILLITIMNVGPLEAIELKDLSNWEFRAPKMASTVALNVAQQLIPGLVKSDEAFSRRLGFASLQDVTDLNINHPPFPVFVIGLTQLRNFDPQKQNPITLLLQEGNFLRWSVPVPARFLYPIQKDTTVKTSVLVAMPTDSVGWRPARIGSSALIRRVTEYGASQNFFVVSIPSLNRHYLGTILGNTFTIKYIYEEIDGEIKGQPGEVRTAQVVFTYLKREAAQVYKNQAPR